MPLYYLASEERDGCGTRSGGKEKSQIKIKSAGMHQALLLKSEKSLTFCSFEKHILKYWFEITDNRGHYLCVFFFIDFSPTGGSQKLYTYAE